MSFCSNCGKECDLGALFCSECGAPISSSSTTVHSDNKVEVSNAPSSIGGIFKKAFSGAQEGIQKMLAIADTKKNVYEIIRTEVAGMDNKYLEFFVHAFVEDNPTSICCHLVKASLICKEAVLSEQLIDSEGEVYATFFKPMMDKVAGCNGYTEFFENQVKNEESFIHRTAEVFFEAILNTNAERAVSEYGNVPDNQLLPIVGVDGFYSPKIIAWRFDGSYKKMDKFSDAVNQYDEKKIPTVREWMANRIFKEIKKEHLIDANQTYHVIHLNDKNKTAINVYRYNDNLHFFKKDAPKIKSRAMLEHLRDEIEMILPLADIEYFREAGEYHRDLKVTGGGTNWLKSDSILVKGVYTDSVKSETVVTDTRYVKVSVVRAKPLEIAFSDYDTLKQIMPEKEYDVVEAIKKNEIIANAVGLCSNVDSTSEDKKSLNHSDDADPVERMTNLKALFDKGLISEEEFLEKKKEILESM